MCNVAKTRSLVSLGLSCFKLVPPSDASTIATEESEVKTNDHTKRQNVTFSVQTFNLMLLCSENYVVEPLSLKFLTDHGFDFNKQYSAGLPYYRGSDKVIDKCICCIITF